MKRIVKYGLILLCVFVIAHCGIGIVLFQRKTIQSNQQSGNQIEFLYRLYIVQYRFRTARKMPELFWPVIGYMLKKKG